MAEHPIRLEKVFFTRSIVVAVPGHKQVEGDKRLTKHPENKLNVGPMEDDPGKFFATMTSRLNQDGDPAVPYQIDMECVGIFFADDTLSADEKHRGVTITAHSVLYGAIREAVLWLTSRQPYGPLMLGLSVLPSKPPEVEKAEPAKVAAPARPRARKAKAIAAPKG